MVVVEKVGAVLLLTGSCVDAAVVAVVEVVLLKLWCCGWQVAPSTATSTNWWTRPYCHSCGNLCTARFKAPTAELNHILHFGFAT